MGTYKSRRNGLHISALMWVGWNKKQASHFLAKGGQQYDFIGDRVFIDGVGFVFPSHVIILYPATVGPDECEVRSLNEFHQRFTKWFPTSSLQETSTTPSLKDSGDSVPVGYSRKAGTAT